MNDEGFKLRHVLKYTAIGVVALGIVSGGIFVLNMATAPMRAVSGVVNKTLDPNNVIAKYEWFHDSYGVFKSRVNQIKVSKSDMETSKGDSGEMARLRVELRAQQQSCRALAEQYNANATKTNQSIFMGREAPERLNPALCE